MLIRRPPDFPTREITDERLFWSRREWLASVGLGLAGSPGLPPGARAGGGAGGDVDPTSHASVTLGLAGSAVLTRVARAAAGSGDDLTPTSYDWITGYNNFYEFGTGKDDPKRNAGTLRPRPWSVSVEGDVKKPAVYDLDDLFKGMKPEERIYRHRCVEAWSMVAPWLGYPLKDVIKRLEPGPKAKFVEFVTLLDPQQMPGERDRVLDWPYVEGLRMDEAMHPLTLLTVGVYGKPLPNQNRSEERRVGQEG